MLFQKAALILKVILLLGTLGLAVRFCKPQNRFHSSPTALRINETYLRAHAAAVNVPPTPTNFSSFHIERDPLFFSRITLPNFGAEDAEIVYGPLQIRQAGSNHSVAISEGSLRLALVGVATAQPQTNTGWISVEPATYYTPDGKRSAEDLELKIVRTDERILSFNGMFPTYQFVFISSNLPDPKPLRFHAFDARTHSSLHSAYRSNTFANGFSFEAELQIWHQTPIELVATIATGPIETYSISNSEGAVLKYPGGQIQLLVKTDNELTIFGSGSFDERSKSAFMAINAPLLDPTARVCSFLFHAWPRAHATPIDFEFVDGSGKVLPIVTSSISGRMMIAIVVGQIADVKEIRLKHYPNVVRVIFTIPELPGLPDQNRNIQNLFDVHIPYIHRRNQYDFQQQGIVKLIQMDQQPFALTFPNAYFPNHRTNTSVRELFLEMESLLTNPDLHLVADPENNEVRAQKPLGRAALEAIKKSFGCEV